MKMLLAEEWLWLFEEFGKVFAQKSDCAIAIMLNGGGRARVSSCDPLYLGRFYADVISPDGHAVHIFANSVYDCVNRLKKTIARF